MEGNISNWEQEILEAWNSIEEIEPTISTQRLFSLVVDETNRDIDDIARVLAKYKNN